MSGVEVYQPFWRGYDVGFFGVVCPYGRTPIFLAPFGKLFVLGEVESFEIVLVGYIPGRGVESPGVKESFVGFFQSFQDAVRQNIGVCAISDFLVYSCLRIGLRNQFSRAYPEKADIIGRCHDISKWNEFIWLQIVVGYYQIIIYFFDFKCVVPRVSGDHSLTDVESGFFDKVTASKVNFFVVECPVKPGHIVLLCLSRQVLNSFNFHWHIDHPSVGWFGKAKQLVLPARCRGVRLVFTVPAYSYVGREIILLNPIQLLQGNTGFKFPFLMGRDWRALARLAGTGYFALSPRYRLFSCVKPPSKGVVFIG